MARLPREIREGDRRLPRYAARLRHPIDDLQGHQALALALGTRGWDLYRAVKHALSGPSLYAARVDLRALIEAAVLTRWLEEDPELRARMWLAEDHRSQLKGSRLGKDFSQRRGSVSPREFTDEEREGMTREIREARVAGRAAGLPVPRVGRVLPTIEAMTESVADLAEARFLYWVLSPFAHAGGRSFVGDDLENVDGRTYLAHHPGALSSASALLGLGIPALLITWASVSRQVGLGMHDDCDALRTAVVFPSTYPLPPDDT